MGWSVRIVSRVRLQGSSAEARWVEAAIRLPAAAGVIVIDRDRHGRLCRSVGGCER